MRRFGNFALAGVAVLGAALAVVALAWAQPNFGLPHGSPPTKSEPRPAAAPVPVRTVAASQYAPVPWVNRPAPPAPAVPIPEPEPTPLALPQEPTSPMPAAPAPVPSFEPLTPTTPQTEPKPAATTEATSPDAGTAVKTPVAPTAPPAEKPRETPVVPARGPLAHQEPAVALEWLGPSTVRVGHATDYNLVVRNTSPAAVQEVMIRVRIPQGLTVVSTEPKGLSEANIYAWELGNLMPKQERTLTVRLLAEGRADMTPQAWVTFTGSSMARIQAREPKLMLKSAAPERALVGDTAAITFTVCNTGDGPAEQVRVNATLSEGLEHPRGNRVAFEVGNLAPGEARSVQVICGTRTGGEQRCEALAEAEGGLKAQNNAVVHVIMPRLDLQLVGPGLRYVDRKAAYTLKVTNPGDAPATNVTVSEVMPAGFKFVSATDGGRLDPSNRTVSWFLGEVGPGQSREVKLEAVAAAVGDQKHVAVAQAARGLKVDAEMITRVEGLSALLLEVDDTEDPIEVGGNMFYEVKLTNTGSKNETDIRVVCLIPDKMEFKGIQPSVKFRQEANMITFEPIANLGPKADVQFRLQCKPTVPGDARFTLQVTSSTLQEPVIEMEATRIYADSVPNR